MTARPTAHQRGYGGKWRREREAFLAVHCRCARCGQPATVVNHKVPHRGDRKLFWSRSNWEPVCAACHNGPIQSEEKRGFSQRVGLDGLPTDPHHPFNQPDREEAGGVETQGRSGGRPVRGAPRRVSFDQSRIGSA